ncbi:MAG: CCA tRNA nucleotidyltransferase [Bacillota bacterium]
MTKLHENGMKILKTLNAASFEAYFVGGYVRDTLLGLPTKDIDITTNARPSDIKALFKKVVPTGAAFGTMSVILDGRGFEITTYRKETVYDNHRHPSSIDFADTLEDDLKRRDFTINQLTMNHEGEIGDMFGGLKDLRKKVIRTIGNPEDRFYEDALRMLRAFRFMARLDFSLEEHTANAIQKHRALIEKLSIERIQEELFRLFDAPHSKRALAAMVETEVHKNLFGLEKGLERLRETSIDYQKEVAFALLDSYTDLSNGPWKFSKKFMQTVKAIKTLHEKTRNRPFTAMDVFSYGKEIALKANTLNRMFAMSDQTADIDMLHGSLPITEKRDLAINGHDILNALPITDKKHISVILERLLEDVVEKHTKNTRENLIERAREHLKLIERSQNNE